MEVSKGILGCGSAMGCNKLVGCIEYHKTSYTMEAQRVVLSWLAAIRTIKDSYAVAMRRGSYNVEVWKFGSSWLATSNTIKVS